jgi:transcriptional regulator with XRE-family HTH domain
MAGRKPGRKRRARTTAEKLLMAEVALKFEAKMNKERWNAEKAAKKLQVSRASFYNYLRKKDLPSFEVLKRAHDLWDLSFQYIDFGSAAAKTAPSEDEQPRQYVLPFIEGVSEGDVEVIRAKPVKPDTLQLTVNIRFAG